MKTNKQNWELMKWNLKKASNELCCYLTESSLVETNGEKALNKVGKLEEELSEVKEFWLSLSNSTMKN